MDTLEKIINLESKIAYLENDIDQLNTVILNQGNQINKLIKQIDDLKTKLDQKKDIEEIKDEKPPHY